MRIKVTVDGPFIVSGGVPLTRENTVANEQGIPEEWKTTASLPHQENYALCRCGRSSGKPYCDGSHLEAGFDGTETAGNQPYLDEARKLVGPGLVLTDLPRLCSGARFCHGDKGTWRLVTESDDPRSKELAIEQTHNCPSGRLITWEKETLKPIKPNFEPEISATHYPELGVSGPLRVKGGITVEAADGTEYETRRQATLCRCGASRNKPFCDASHVGVGFYDENCEEP